MGYSLRSAAVMRARQRQRQLDQAEAVRRAAAAAAEFHRTWMNRRRAAAFLGVSFDRLRRLMTAGTSPAYAKGSTKQSRPLFHRDDLVAWRNDPAGYQAVRQQRMAELAAPHPL